ncbi:HAMP domain-containing sensor histidine kinase [Sorangium sp. So ce136]|uniref:ATP-binding protein n=1 Tax=Sorangium sp. So ce136 TaxID=3133284 RepID=UPI003EFEC4A5
MASTFTTDESRNGTGLGLAIVKSVVEAHGRVVTVESAPGEGARFVVEIPVRQ